jgi:uncharacterized protein YndB with AHSA1/START domain
MPDPTQTLRFEKTIAAPVAHVYRAFTNATALREWMCDVATVDPKPGGRIYLAWVGDFYASGAYEEVVKDEKIAFTWHGRGEPHPTRVEVLLAPRQAGVSVTLVHSGLGEAAPWDQIAQAFRSNWESSLENLASVLEKGPDLRLTRRPMMGIYLSDFDAQIAAHMGVPVEHGIRLDGVVEGMGAQAAGLQKEDVLIRMAGRELKAYDDLQLVLMGQHAGDTIEVIYYRGAEKRSAAMTLSGRRIPEIPTGKAALAEAVKKSYAEANAELAAALQGVSAEEAAQAPEPGEWSPAQVLAHLLHGERGTIAFVTEWLGCQERWSDDYGGNDLAPVQATFAAYGSVDALLQAIHTAQAELVALIEHLPDEAVAHKGSWWRLAYGLVESPSHIRTHAAQIQAAIQAARK